MSGGDGARILVVDDVPENLRLLEAVLAPRGYDVVSATDAGAALELVESANPDLVLLDVVMPEMDGYSVCRALREREKTAVLPVIMITASSGPEKIRAIEAGADDFIPKPLNHHELLVRVRSLLRIKRYHDTIKAQAADCSSSTGRSKSAFGRRSRSLSGWGGCDGSSHRGSRTRSSRRATSRSCAATAGRSRCSSPTCAAGRPS
jgi:DNA-binding response OmpR family regulator